jgi:hypothetical protein
LHPLNRNSNVHVAVNHQYVFAVYNDTLNIFSKTGHFIKSYPYNISSNSYWNTLLTADTKYVYSNRKLSAISIATGEVSPYVEGANGGGFIYRDRYWYQSGRNAYTYKTISVISSLEKPDPMLQDFHLLKAYPNPFNPVTTIVYRLNKISDVELSVYNILGQHVTKLVKDRQPAGEHHVKWHAHNYSSGMYFYLLQVNEKQQIMRGVLLK